MTVPDTPAFAKDDRVIINNPNSVLHGLAGTVVDVDHGQTARYRTLTSTTAYRVLIDGDTYPLWLPPEQLKAK